MNTTNITPMREGAPNPEPLPDWLKETPDHEETGYCLQVDPPGTGLVKQEVKVTRDEYEMLKRTGVSPVF